MGEIKLLPGGSAAPHMPDPSVISLLEDALEQAKRGEVVAAAIVLARPNYGYTTNWANSGANRFTLFAGAHRLANCLSGDE